MEIKNSFIYKGRYACRLENGLFLMSADSMHIILCRKVDEGYKVIQGDIVGGMMIRNMNEFLTCAETFNPQPGEIPEWDEATATMQEKRTDNREKARLLATRIKEEIGMSEHSIERVTEIIRKGCGRSRLQRMLSSIRQPLRRRRNHLLGQRHNPRIPKALQERQRHSEVHQHGSRREILRDMQTTS